MTPFGQQTTPVERDTPAAPPERQPNPRLMGPGRTVYVAGVLALTEPGPAAAGIVIADQEGRVLSQRSYYLGLATRSEATAQALLAALRLAVANALEAPVFRVEDPSLSDALAKGKDLPDRAAALTPVLREVAAELPGYRLAPVSPAANPARPLALAPLVDWLPERTRRAEELAVRSLGNHTYEVASESHPGQVYHVTLVPPGDGVPGQPVRMQCECADFLYRGMPCKHLLAVARQAGLTQRLFYAEPVRPPEPALGGGVRPAA